MEETSDLVQSVCREILTNRERFQFSGEKGFRRWLYTSAQRKVPKRVEHNHAQKRDISANVPYGEGSRNAREGAILNSYRSICTPSCALSSQEEVERIESAFDELTESSREIITLWRLVGL
ncbi:MAG: RNA polymerase sigma factor (sigma-70 family) [Planctomycetota bacterium]|jgi:RNA polymerase sigma factor (sigma-70 family)